jgi:hypothetical protein
MNMHDVLVEGIMLAKDLMVGMLETAKQSPHRAAIVRDILKDVKCEDKHFLSLKDMIDTLADEDNWEVSIPTEDEYITAPEGSVIRLTKRN